MPSASPKTRKKVKQQIKQRSSRRGLYILGIIILLIVIGVGWYVYASSTSTVGANGIVYAKINTSKGTIVVELYSNSAPKTVANFVSLANQGFYNNLVWHRIKAGFVIQTGDPNTRNGGGNRTTWGQGGSPQTVPLEIDSSLHNNVGYLGMARLSTDTNSGSSQFYVNLANNNSLDGSYTVFGKVISGMDVAYALGNVPTTTQYSGAIAPQPVDPASAMLLGVTISNTP